MSGGAAVQRVRSAWGALESVEWSWPLATLGQWGLVAASAGTLYWIVERIAWLSSPEGQQTWYVSRDFLRQVETRVLLPGNVIDALIVPVAVGFASLVVVSSIAVRMTKRAFRRAMARPGILRRRRRATIRRALLLGIVTAGSYLLARRLGYLPLSRTVMVGGPETFVMLVYVAAWGWLLGLSWLWRRRLFLVGVIGIVLAPVFGWAVFGLDVVTEWALTHILLGLSRVAGRVPDPVAWGTDASTALSAGLRPINYLALGFIAMSVSLVVMALRASAVSAPGSARSSRQPWPGISESPSPPQGPPQSVELPRSPATGMVRRRLDL
ncbi:MAG: hypothetical protein ACE5NC_05750 [Anaerolineae bacterium]